MSNTIGSWYESTGPSADFVRKDIFRTIKKKPDERIIVDEERDRKIIAILLKNIPDTMTGFGSWRGYFSFGFYGQISREDEMRSRLFFLVLIATF